MNFKGNESVDYLKPLDRSWYNNLSGEFEELSPKIVIRDGFEVENCGFFKRNIINMCRAHIYFIGEFLWEFLF